MGPNPWRGTDIAGTERSVRVAMTLAVALVMVTTAAAGAVAAADTTASQQQERNETYAVVQGEYCTEITPLSGNESVKSFYDYRTPFADNPYTNRSGQSYSSEGTASLQRPRTSTLFLYEDGNGTLSLVFLHGSLDGGSDGGAISVTIAGLPDDGSWTVKDDEYAGGDNYDVWQTSDDRHQVDWTWAGNNTDGGAFSGLGDSFTITITPAFNADAELYGDYYDGTVRRWTALSQGANGTERAPLTARRVIVSSEGCSAS